MGCYNESKRSKIHYLHGQKYLRRSNYVIHSSLLDLVLIGVSELFKLIVGCCSSSVGSKIHYLYK
jgi:hypothetical protein